MCDEQDCSSAFDDLAHLVKTFLLKIGITDGQHLIDNQDLRIEMRCHGKCKAYVHAAGVSFYRCFEESFCSRESHDFIKSGIDLPAAHSQDGAVQLHVR